MPIMWHGVINSGGWIGTSLARNSTGKELLFSIRMLFYLQCCKQGIKTTLIDIIMSEPFCLGGCTAREMHRWNWYIQ